MLWVGHNHGPKYRCVAFKNKNLKEMENRIQLTLMGLSYNPLQNGAFALLLSAKESDKRIPIIIGAPEAQAIARMAGRCA